MRIDLSTPEKIETFLSTCTAFLPFVLFDCAGLSPGVDHFRESAEGLAQLKETHLERVALLDRMIAFYETLRREAPGPRNSMYPRGSAMFGDLKSIQALDAAMSEWLDDLSA